MKGVVAVLAAAVVIAWSAEAQDTGPVTTEGIVDAAVDQVWAAFTTSEGLRAWMAPHADIDLRVGGLMRANYNAQGQLGDPETIENAILSFEPLRMLSIRVARAPASFPFQSAIHEMWTVIYFSPAGPDRTTFRGVSLGFGNDPESQRMRAFFEQGNAATLSRLQKHFANRNR